MRHVACIYKNCSYLHR